MSKKKTEIPKIKKVESPLSSGSMEVVATVTIGNQVFHKGKVITNRDPVRIRTTFEALRKKILNDPHYQAKIIGPG